LSTNSEALNKIIKIQSFARGMKMRDQIKLKYRPKVSNNITSLNLKKTEFIYENTITKKVEETDIELQKKFDEIIVKNIL